MLITKLHIPPIGDHVVHRPELYDKLNSGLNRKLILVSAPAGFGKTTVLCNWIESQKIPAAWFSIDDGDNDPAAFLGYVIFAIQTLHPGFGQTALKLLHAPNHPSAESIAGLLTNEILRLNRQLTLVLDDFHLISSDVVLKLTAFILEHMPANIHLAILTRSDPALSLSRLRSQHQLTEIRASDLGFSANDISILFNKLLKIRISPEDALALEIKTEGWIAGLQLTALSMQSREDISGFIQDLKGDNRYIMDYLMEEVLKNQSPETRDFLLRTSILEQMSAPLCNAVLQRNDSQLFLEALEKNNMFVVPLDGDRTWYRYHHLFAELLKHRLGIMDKTTVHELHLAASAWFHQHAFPLLAVEHALKAEDFVRSLELLGKEAETLWVSGHHAAILKYGDLLPDTLIKSDPDFCLYYAWILIITGQILKAEPFLSQAEIRTREALQYQNPSEASIGICKKRLGKICVAFAFMYAVLSQKDKVHAYSRPAMELLSEEDPLWYAWALYTSGIDAMFRDDFSTSISAFKTGLVYAKRTGNIYLLSTIGSRVSAIEARMGLYASSYRDCVELILFMQDNGYAEISRSESTFAGLYSYMAGVEAMRTDFDDALENIKTAHSLCRKESDNTFNVNMFVIYSLILYGRGDVEGSGKMLKNADDILKQHIIFPGAMAMYIAMKGFLLVEEHEFEKARHFFREHDLRFDKKIAHTEELGYSSYALLLIIEGKLREAEMLLSNLLHSAHSAKRLERVIEIHVLIAILNKASGNREQALSHLMEALTIASEDHILMSFVLFHSWISDLLKEVFRLQATTKTGISRRVTDKLKQALEKREKSLRVFKESGISERERDTLKLMAEELTNQEIADALFISLNTVKTHVKNIFLKLDTDTRSSAVSKAKALGLI